jgi:cation transport ATPase
VLRIARQCRRIILTNFVGTLVADVVGVGLAAFGYLNPIVAALIHVVSELVFIGNSARLLAGGGVVEEQVAGRQPAIGTPQLAVSRPS